MSILTTLKEVFLGKTDDMREIIDWVVMTLGRGVKAEVVRDEDAGTFTVSVADIEIVDYSMVETMSKHVRVRDITIRGADKAVAYTFHVKEKDDALYEASVDRGRERAELEFTGVCADEDLVDCAFNMLRILPSAYNKPNGVVVVEGERGRVRHVRARVVSGGVLCFGDLEKLHALHKDASIEISSNPVQGVSELFVQATFKPKPTSTVQSRTSKRLRIHD